MSSAMFPKYLCGAVPDGGTCNTFHCSHVSLHHHHHSWGGRMGSCPHSETKSPLGPLPGTEVPTHLDSLALGRPTLPPLLALASQKQFCNKDLRVSG